MSAQECLGNAICYGGQGSIRSAACRDSIFVYCTGVQEEGDDWIRRWWEPQNELGSTCTTAISRHLSTFDDYDQCYVTPRRPDGTCRPVDNGKQINSETWAWAKRLLETAVTRYRESGYLLNAKSGEPGYTPFNDEFSRTICCMNPGLCQSILDDYCRQFSTSRVSNSTSLRNLCGCHMSALNYQEYSQKYNIERQCSSLCNGSEVVPLVGVAGDVIECEQDVCIIDNTTLTLSNDTVGGNVSFEQACGFSDGPVSCTIADSIVEVINTEIGGNLVPVLEQCGTMTCTSQNVSQYCTVDDVLSYQQKARRIQNGRIRVNGIITAGIALVVLTVIILIYVYVKDGRSGGKATRHNSR
uniref:DUF5857 domain-containing protein n=1 Tax=viral metagenome TaxID=1070528 RepID=A0A6C0JW25_9ZZZZ